MEVQDMYENEVWKDLPTWIEPFKNVYPNVYKVSNYGRVRGIRRANTPDGCMAYNLSDTGCSITISGPNMFRYKVSVKMLVMYTFDFRPDYDKHMIINMNGDLSDNRLDNLVWDDYIKFGKPVMCRISYNNMPHLDNERWLPIIDIGELKGLCTYGMYVSNLGRIWDAQPQRIIGYREEDDGPNTYQTIVLKDRDGNIRNVVVHRIVMLIFNYIPGCENLQVNHIDGIKYHNWLSNLEWVTCQGNIQHAYKSGLSYQIGDTHTESIYSNDLVGRVVQMVVDGYSGDVIMKVIPEINKIGFIMDIRACRSRVSSIAQYLINIGKTPKNVFGEARTKELISMCINYPSSTVFREAIGCSNPASYEYFVSGVLYYIVTHGVTWIPFINL